MTDAATSTTPTSKPARGVKRGLPTQGLRQAEESAAKLWGCGSKGHDFETSVRYGSRDAKHHCELVPHEDGTP